MHQIAQEAAISRPTLKQWTCPGAESSSHNAADGSYACSFACFLHWLHRLHHELLRDKQFDIGVHLLHEFLFESFAWAMFSVYAGYHPAYALAVLSRGAICFVWVVTSSIMPTLNLLMMLLVIEVGLITQGLALDGIQTRYSYAELKIQMENDTSIALHIVKNSLAEILAESDVHKSKQRKGLEAGVCETALLQDKEERGVEVMDRIAAQANRGIRWCKQFQSLMAMRAAAGPATIVQPVEMTKLREYLQSMFPSVRFAIQDALSLHLHSVAFAMLLENALDNAQKHAAPDAPDILCSIHAEPSPDLHVPGPCPFCPSSSALSSPSYAQRTAVGKCRSWRLCRRLTSNAVYSVPSPCSHLMRTTVTVDNNVPQGFQLPKNALELAAQPRRSSQSALSLSEGLGLRHCIHAARVLQASIDLSQSHNKVVFKVVLHAYGGVPPAAGLAQDAAPPEAEARPGTDTIITGLKICYINGARAMRSWMDCALSELGAVESFGATSVDVEPFIATAMGSHIAICDENLEVPDKGMMGPDLILRLLSDGYTGLCCIFSSNDTEADQQKYAAKGAHLTLGKGMRRQQLAEALRAAYGRHIRPRPEAGDAQPTGAGQGPSGIEDLHLSSPSSCASWHKSSGHAPV